MIYISHRGNIDKKNISEENLPEKINYCLSIHYEVEIDVWNLNNKFYLGHDEPQYEIKYEFLLQKNLWCHAKNINALKSMLKYKTINCFWHQEDSYTLTSFGYIWVFPGKELIENSVAVMPENSNYSLKDLKKCYAICSDQIQEYKRKIQ